MILKFLRSFLGNTVLGALQRDFYKVSYCVFQLCCFPLMDTQCIDIAHKASCQTCFPQSSAPFVTEALLFLAIICYLLVNSSCDLREQRCPRLVVNNSFRVFSCFSVCWNSRLSQTPWLLFAWQNDTIKKIDIKVFQIIVQGEASGAIH